MANEDSTNGGSVDEVMTTVDGVRVRKDEQKQYVARHKAVLAPAAVVDGAVEASARKAGTKRPAAKSAVRRDGA